jgi:hypothetical protein
VVHVSAVVSAEKTLLSGSNNNEQLMIHSAEGSGRIEFSTCKALDLYENQMIQKISRTPLLFLFILSVLPALLINGNSQIWAFTNFLIFIFFSLWVYSIVKRLVTVCNLQIKTNKFTGTLIFTTIYGCLLSVYFAFTYNKYDDPKWLLPIIIVGQFLFFAGVVSVVLFFAKIIALGELRRPAKSSEYIGYIVMIIFFPIGIWRLYPKIQSLINI